MSKQNKFPAKDGWLTIKARYKSPSHTPTTQQEALEQLRTTPSDTEVGYFRKWKKCIEIIIRNKPKQP